MEVPATLTSRITKVKTSTHTSSATVSDWTQSKVSPRRSISLRFLISGHVSFIDSTSVKRIRA